MRISYKKINVFIFCVAFFLQSFIDGFYIAHDMNPAFLKVLKYGFFILGIIWGVISIQKNRLCYWKETEKIIVSIYVVFLISLFLIAINNGNLGITLEITFRFSIAIIYAFVLLNIFDLDDIYKLMVYVLLVSIMGWILEKGVDIFNIANFGAIAFADSSSPFESSYFAAPSINCCAFFMYYRKNKIISSIAFLFALLTFKRPAIVFSIIFLVVPFFINVDKKISKKMIFIGETLCVICTVLWYNLLLKNNNDLFMRIIGDTSEHFTQGRSKFMNMVLETGYHAAGLGSTNNIVGHGIEMDLIQLFLETTIIGLSIIVFAYISAAGRNMYALMLMVFHMFTCLTGSGLYNSFGWVPVFVTFGCINYKKSVKLQMRFPLLRRRKND